jgi:hypothetical protein
VGCFFFAKKAYPVFMLVDITPFGGESDVVDKLFLLAQGTRSEREL